MTKLLSSHSLQVRVTGVTGGSFDGDLKQNIKKRVEKILYLESPPDDAVLLSYVGSKELSPDNNLFIGDRSDSLYVNSRAGRAQEFIGDINPLKVNNSNFIVTQKFNGSTPLYYKQELPINIVAESIRLYDKDFNVVNDDRYLIETEHSYDEDTGIEEPSSENKGYFVFNNLESSYDPISGEYDVFFIQYTDTSEDIDVVVTQLLSNELAYQEATFEDIWSVTLSLKPWSHAYLWDGADSFVTLPTSSKFAIRYEENKRISVNKPAVLSDTSPWFTRVTNGSFITGYDSYSYKYHIPEFHNQAFNPIAPYKLAVRTSGVKVDKHLLKFPHGEIYNGLSSYVDIVFERDGVVTQAVTNNPDKENTDYSSFGETVFDEDGTILKWSSSKLLGVESISGIAQVNFEIADDSDIYCTYTYKEDSYTVTGLNMNPIFDSGAAVQLRTIYLVPESVVVNNNAGHDSAIHYVKSTQSGFITDCSQDGDDGNENISQDVSLTSEKGHGLTGVVGLHYNWKASTVVSEDVEVLSSQMISVSSTKNFPYKGWIRFLDSEDVFRYARYESKSEGFLVLSDDAEEVASSVTALIVSAGSTIELVNFIDERTTISTRDTDETNHVLDGEIPVSYSRYFVLSEMSINPPHSHKDLVHIDVRQNGGGIKKDKYEEAKLKNPKAQWLSDNGSLDGQVYPGNSVIVVKLPIGLLKKYTENQLYEIVEQNIPIGTKPLIRFFGYKPSVLYVGPKGSEEFYNIEVPNPPEVPDEDDFFGFGEGPFGDYEFGFGG